MIFSSARVPIERETFALPFIKGTINWSLKLGKINMEELRAETLVVLGDDSAQDGTQCEFSLLIVDPFDASAAATQKGGVGESRVFRETSAHKEVSHAPGIYRPVVG